MSPNSTRILFVGGLLMLAGCGDGGQERRPAAQEILCPSSADRCAPPCIEVQGIPINVEASCKGPPLVVGCMAKGAMTTDGHCTRRNADGALFFLSGSTIRPPEWSLCSLDESEVAQKATRSLCEP